MLFWERFCKLCNEKNSSPNAVAKEIIISSGTLTKWKNGVLPNGESLTKLINYFDCSADYLLGRSNNPKPNNVLSLSNASGNNIIQGNPNATITVQHNGDDPKLISKEENEILNLITSLEPVARYQLLLDLHKRYNL